MSLTSCKALVILMIIVVLMKQTLCQSELLPYRSRRAETARRYCGRRLSDVLQLVCKGLFNGMFADPDKRAGEGLERDDYQYYDSSPFRSREDASDLMFRLGIGGFRRYRRGAHDECCLKSCLFSEMKSYCAAA